MKSVFLLLLATLATARGLYSCCAYELEGGGCDIIQCPGECVFVGDECPNRADNGCFLQQQYNLGDNGCETCECDPYARARSLATGTSSATGTTKAPGQNKYGSLKIAQEILVSQDKPKPSKPPKKQ